MLILAVHVQGDVKGSVVEFDKAMELDPGQRPCAVIIHFARG